MKKFTLFRAWLLSLTASIVLPSRGECQTTNQATGGFHLQASPSRGPVRMGPAWFRPSVISCAAACTARYRENCTSFMFNSMTKLCVPGSVIRDSSPKPSSAEGNLYSSIYCKKDIGFNVVTISVTACLGISPGLATYQQAKAYCKNNGAILMSVKTIDKMNLIGKFNNINPTQYVWVGCNCLIRPGVFAWEEDEEQLSQNTMTDVFFIPTQSNLACANNCVKYSVQLKKLLVAPCTESNRFMCEVPLP